MMGKDAQHVGELIDTSAPPPPNSRGTPASTSPASFSALKFSATKQIVLLDGGSGAGREFLSKSFGERHDIGVRRGLDGVESCCVHVPVPSLLVSLSIGRTARAR